MEIEGIDGNELEVKIEQDKVKEAEITICKHFVRLGWCLFADACRYRHPSEEEIDALEIRYQRTRRPGGRLQVRNENRASELRFWLLNHFGKDRLASGSGIADIAGGKGELSFELLNLNQVPVTVFDPRPLFLHRYERKWNRGYYHRPTLLNQKYNYVEHCKHPPLEKYRNPSSVRLFFEPFLYDPEMDDELRVRLYEKSILRAHDSQWTRKGLVIGENESEAQEWKEEEMKKVPPLDDLREMLKDVSVFVGMHPDQAAEAVVDAAIQFRKAFAVLPCCVYSKQFPNRRKRDGTLVSTYDILVEYLMEKDERIQKLVMNFEGKNVLLYGDFSKDESLE
mmetsp:Transcript_5790/g.10239  ORF Transcript_5790/g.10239 Transcript_5790/m.10239 type:complete len:338 (+) Transcript_5790:33-1046(+)